MAAPNPLADRAAFSFFKTETLRFSDTDMVGHVNNVAFAALFETGRTYYTHEARFPMHPADMQPVLARIEIDYRAELHWPGSVDVGTALISLGNSSFVLGSGIFLGERCVATARAVLVLIDRATRRPAAIPPGYRSALEAVMEASGDTGRGTLRDPMRDSPAGPRG